MSIATYYAFDKVRCYFSTKYIDFWKDLDNKIFATQIIEKEKIPVFEGVSNARKELFIHYIKTGKYEMKDDDKHKFDFIM